MQRIPNIVQSRLRAETPANHPDANQLSAFAEKSLTERERRTVLEHLSLCGECRDVLALALPAAELIQPWVTPSPTRWLTWPVLRWGVITAGIAVIASFGLLQYQHHAQFTARLAQPASRSDGGKLAAKVLPAPMIADPPAPKINQNPEPSDKKKPTQETQDRTLAASLPSAPRPNAMGAREVATQSQSSPTLSSPSLQNQLAPQPNIASELSKKIPAASEVVEVQAAAARPEADSDARVGKAKDATPDNIAAAQTNQPVSGRNVTELAAVEPGLAPRWNITSSGGLQRSFNQGATWLDVDVTTASSTNAVVAGPLKATGAEADATGMSLKKQSAPPIFRAVAANGADVWAGGGAGMLYHSTDSGNHWTRILPSGAGSVLTGDIVSVEFPDPQHGKITTSTPEVWTTPDNGETWQKQ